MYVCVVYVRCLFRLFSVSAWLFLHLTPLTHLPIPMPLDIITRIKHQIKSPKKASPKTARKPKLQMSLCCNVTSSLVSFH